MSMNIVILGAGDFPSSPQALSVLHNADFLCCCDSAGKSIIDYLDSFNGSLHLGEGNGRGLVIVGDGDSLPQSFKEKYAAIYHQIDEQDYNDLTKATRFCVERFQSDGETLTITYLGATGKREDHTIGNISLLTFFRRTFGISPVMVTDFGTFTAHNGDSTLKTFPRQQVSVFNLSCHTISSEGLKWEAYPFTELWQGTLNEALGTSVSLHADGEYIVYRTHEPK